MDDAGNDDRGPLMDSRDDARGWVRCVWCCHRCVGDGEREASSGKDNEKKQSTATRRNRGKKDGERKESETLMSWQTASVSVTRPARNGRLPVMVTVWSEFATGGDDEGPRVSAIAVNKAFARVVRRRRASAQPCPVG